MLVKRRIFIVLLFLLTAALFFACAGEFEQEESSGTDNSLQGDLQGNSSLVSSASSQSDGTSLPESSSETTSAVEASEESSADISSADETSSAASSEEPSTSTESNQETSKEPEETSKEPDPQPIKKPHTVNGFLVYDYRAMEQFGGGATGGQLTAGLLNKLKERVGADVNVYAMPIPNASAYYAPEGYERAITNTQNCVYGMRDALVDVQFVDVYSALLPHTDEEIYARTDHHWFALGAYYAAEELCKTAGVDFAPLSQFERKSFDGFLGSAYSAYGVSELAARPETFVWFEPMQNYTVNYYNHKFRSPTSGSLFTSSKGYTKFIRGDGNAVQIQTDVSNGRKLLVIKDSYGNALAPFLIAGFEEVYIIDMRFFECNILKFIDDYQITDVSLSISVFTAAGSKRDHITRLMNQ